MAIKECKCSGTKSATFQDLKYGKWKRVCNPTGSGKKGTSGWTCTACGHQVIASAPQSAPKEDEKDKKKSK